MYFQWHAITYQGIHFRGKVTRNVIASMGNKCDAWTGAAMHFICSKPVFWTMYHFNIIWKVLETFYQCHWMVHIYSLCAFWFARQIIIGSCIYMSVWNGWRWTAATKSDSFHWKNSIFWFGCLDDWLIVWRFTVVFQRCVTEKMSFHNA